MGWREMVAAGCRQAGGEGGREKETAGQCAAAGKCFSPPFSIKLGISHAIVPTYRVVLDTLNLDR